MSTLPRILTLNLNGQYFDEIKAGTKTEEYRQTSKWRKRLEGKVFDQIVLCRGYPRSGDMSKRIVKPWQGMREIMLTHPHFGNVPESVFAIDVSGATIEMSAPNVD